MAALQHQRGLVQHGHRQVLDDAVRLDVAEQCDLLPVGFLQRLVHAGDDDIRHDAHALQFLDGMLCGLCLVLAAGFDVRHQRDVDEQTVFPPGLDAYLADGLQKRGGFNVARGAADLRDNNVGIRLFPHGIDKAFDLARDMGNDLHRLAQIFAAAFFGEHVPVYLSRSEVGVLVQILVDKAFIMPQVQVGLRAVLGHEYLAVLIGAHGAGVYIDIRVQLLGRHPEPSGL